MRFSLERVRCGHGWVRCGGLGTEGGDVYRKVRRLSAPQGLPPSSQRLPPRSWVTTGGSHPALSAPPPGAGLPQGAPTQLSALASSWVTAGGSHLALSAPSGAGSPPGTPTQLSVCAEETLFVDLGPRAAGRYTTSSRLFGQF